MAARIIVDMSGGRIVLFGGAPETGRPDASPSDGFTRASADEFSAALFSIGEIAKAFEASIDAMPKRPRNIDIEFGATLSDECDLWIVGEGADPEFRVTLSWGEDD